MHTVHTECICPMTVLTKVLCPVQQEDYLDTHCYREFHSSHDRAHVQNNKFTSELTIYLDVKEKRCIL